MNIIYRAVIFIIVFQLSANAQFSLSGGYNKIFNQVFWDQGTSAQIEYIIPIKYGRTFITFCGVYNHFYNSGNLPNLAVPAEWGFEREFSVTPLYFFDILTNIEYHFSDSDFHLFISFGFGASYHSLNPVKMREWFDYSNYSMPSFNDYMPFQYSLEPLYQLAIGYNIPLTSNYSIGPRLSYYRNLYTCINRFSSNIFINIRL
jgi:hypothetical protein